jgi:hypothetical protein
MRWVGLWAALLLACPAAAQVYIQPPPLQFPTAYYAIDFNDGRSAAGIKIELDGDDATNTDGVPNDYMYPCEGSNSYCRLGGTSILTTGGVASPRFDATGLDIGGHTAQALDDEVEIYGGVTNLSGRPMLGQTEAFEACFKLYIDDISGTNLWCGWRGGAANGASGLDFTTLTLTSYDAYAGVRINNGAITTDDATNGSAATGLSAWVDEGVHDVCVRFALDGAATYNYDGGAYSSMSYTIGQYVPLVPACAMIHLSDLGENTLIRRVAVRP